MDFIGGLFIAWFLSLFGVYNMITTSAKEVLNITISESTYYMLFAIIGLIGGAFGSGS